MDGGGGVGRWGGGRWGVGRWGGGRRGKAEGFWGSIGKGYDLISHRFY